MGRESEEAKRLAGRLRDNARLITWVGLGLFFGYAAIMLGPYVRSALVRDAAVTTWIHIATSPIYGEVAEALPKPGDRVGEAGLIARIFNPKADRSRLDRALAKASEAEAVDEAAEAYLAELEQTVAERRRLLETHRKAYRIRLDAELAGVSKRLARAQEDLVVFQRLTARKEQLAERGSAALSDLDESRSRLLESQRLLANLEAQAASLSASLDVLQEGTVLTTTGDGPIWGPVGLLDLEAALSEARFQHEEAEARLTNAWAEVASEEETYETLRQGEVRAPADAILWSTIVGEGAAVDIGTPVASWIDCSLLLVDVPLADAEVALLEIGSPARVIFEGESKARSGRVILTRGSAATIARDDLAAIAKGRTQGVAQALLSLDSDDSAFKTCPVGRAAYVDFDSVGFLDVLAARLRF